MTFGGSGFYSSFGAHSNANVRSRHFVKQTIVVGTTGILIGPPIKVSTVMESTWIRKKELDLIYQIRKRCALDDRQNVVKHL